jgi:hypothetical protein
MNGDDAYSTPGNGNEHRTRGQGRGSVVDDGSLIQRPIAMATVKSISIERHLIEMRANQAAWRRRPVLRKIYARFYELIYRAVAPLPGPAVELGSGIGAVKEFIPDCITTDIFPNPRLDQQENAYRLTFTDFKYLQPNPSRRLTSSYLSGNSAERIPSGFTHSWSSYHPGTGDEPSR